MSLERYARMVWEGGRWVERARGDDAYDLGRGAFGFAGEDWTIRCLGCGNDSKFYGCHDRSCPRTSSAKPEGNQ